jgi:hypothetical protein
MVFLVGGRLIVGFYAGLGLIVIFLVGGGLIMGFSPLSTILQGGDREFCWSGSPLTFVLIHAKVGMRDMGQPLQMTLRLLSKWMS